MNITNNGFLDRHPKKGTEINTALPPRHTKIDTELIVPFETKNICTVMQVLQPDGSSSSTGSNGDSGVDHAENATRM